MLYKYSIVKGNIEKEFKDSKGKTKTETLDLHKHNQVKVLLEDLVKLPKGSEIELGNKLKVHHMYKNYDDWKDRGEIEQKKNGGKLVGKNINDRDIMFWDLWKQFITMVDDGDIDYKNQYGWFDSIEKKMETAWKEAMSHGLEEDFKDLIKEYLKK